MTIRSTWSACTWSAVLSGTLLIGLVAAPETGAGVAGLFYGGGFDQLWRQAVGAGAVLVYCAIATDYLGSDSEIHRWTAP